MKPKNTILSILSGFWMLTLFFLGCTDDHELHGVTNEKTATVTLDLQVPGVLTGVTTRATEKEPVEQEKAITNLQVLVFEKTASEEEVYRDIIKEVNKDSETQVTLKLPISDAEYRFVVLANADAQTIKDGTPKADALNQFTFECAGIWNAGGADSKSIPMWGEYGQTISIKKDNSISILLHRALARVDVGLMFKEQTQDTQTDEVEGLDNFKIKSVRVYRTKNLAYVGTDKIINDAPATAPNIPADAKFNPGNYDKMEEADTNPLVYTLDTPADSYVREIYIPESFDASGTPTMDEVPCLVIGGYYGKDSTNEITYYRADFANYEGGKVGNYKSILRNHRYVFNIKSVSSPGFKEPEQALKSITTGLNLTVEKWHEVPLNMHISGDYYFQIERREVWLDAASPEEHAFVFASIPYRTNIPLILDPDTPGPGGELQKIKNVELSFESSGTAQSDQGFFPLFLINDYPLTDGPLLPGGTISIGIGKDDVSGVNKEPKHDVLTVTIENLQFTIDVYQEALDLEYKLICDETEVHGKYREGIPLNYSNYLTMKISFNEPPSEQSTDVIEVTSETRKGISFQFKGTVKDMEKVTSQEYKIKLQGQGTPVKDLNDPISPDKEDGILTPIRDLVITANSSIAEHRQCTTDIIFGYKTKRILAIGANASYRYGYQLEPNTGSRAFVDASINFGVDPNSTVTMEQFPNNYTHPGTYPNKSDASARGNAFHIEYITTGRGIGGGDKIDADYLKEMMDEFKPDIILTGQAIQYQNDDINMFYEFIEKGGVFLMFNEYYPKAASINAMVEKVMGSGMDGSNITTRYTEIVYDIKDAGYPEEDPILKGPFSDKDAQGKVISLAGQHWGSDGICLHGYTGINSTNAYVYSTRKYHDNAACIFRHKTKPFFFIGDGGFISNSKRYIGHSYQGSYVYCPFAINSAYQPVDRINYTNAKNQTVCNSRFFGNILAWAVDYAEHYGINSK